MSHKSIDSCTLKLNSWKPFHTLNTTSHHNPNSNSKPQQSSYPKRPCLSDRSTTSLPIDISNLTLFDDDRPIFPSSSSAHHKAATNSLRLLAGKRRRRGSRSVSGRSSDTNRRCSSSVGAAYANCSDWCVPIGTDSSGELFINNAVEVNWGSGVSEARSVSRKEKDCGVNGVVQFVGGLEGQGNGNESGYGSEPGYRGDAELGYGDEFDGDDDDHRPSFWGDRFEDQGTKMEVVGDNSFSEQKAHHRCRRKKHDCSRMMDTSR